MNNDKMIKRLPSEWEKLFGLEIVDPDGWRGKNGKPMTEPITGFEFAERASDSTIYPVG